MRDPLAAYLDSIATTPVPARLQSIEGDVLAAIDAAAREDADRRRLGRFSIGAALALGLAGGGLIGGGLVGGAVRPAVASPMSIDSLAPSTLLLGR